MSITISSITAAKRKRHTTYNRLKKQVHLLLDPSDGGTIWDKVVNSVIVALILLNLLAVCLETVESLYREYGVWFRNFELFSVLVFSVEYLLRVWSCTSMRKYRHPVRGRLRYVTSPGMLVDLAAILPFYLPLSGLDLRSLRLLRMIRFMRFFKLARFLNASRVIRRVFASKRNELLISMLMVLTLIILAASLMYFVEHDAQPDKFSSIPETMWWSVATLTTVGYGDVYPVTGIGKTLTACISILGIGMFALPAGILASGFSEEFKKRETASATCCPHCGKEIHHG
ncbi:ion transporter [Mucilaginibacter sp. 44-25]|uniref:ion transporter n=1 Tax=Mucilaginibacter sp. 44-25 TaxID=1895794 RepID=UPI000961995D|nr:ion transporter [Mucilaginibacter sp. 44-25]OJW17287.1 MAG: potassium channel protein [Mucilaginibacter sp. 44-25]